MHRITKWAMANKAAILVIVFFSLLVGIFSYSKMPRELQPSMEVSTISITTVGQSMDSNSMLVSATEPIERAVANVKGQSSVISTTGDGYSQVTIKFQLGIKMKEAVAETEKIVNGLQLPAGVSKPYIYQPSTDSMPVSILGIGLSEQMSSTGMDKINNEIIPRLQKITDVGSIRNTGGVMQNVIIRVDPGELSKHKISMESLMSLLNGQNLVVSLGSHVVDNTAVSLKVVGNLNDLQSLGELNVAADVKLSDVAKISLSKDTKTMTHLNGQDGVVLLVNKVAGGNAVEVGKNIASEIKKMNEDYKGDIETSLVWSSDSFITGSVNSMMREVLLGTLFATLIIFLFLRNWRMTLITIISIPLSLAITLFFLSLSGISLNVITIGGIAVAIGRLVDDSIVVIENLYRRSQTEGYTKDVIIDSVKDVAGAITLSTLTSVCVFLPLGLVKGLSAMILPFALTVTYSLLASLFVAITVVPLLGHSFMKNAKPKKHKQVKSYQAVLKWTLNHKFITLAATFVLLIGSIVAYGVIPKGTINNNDTSQIDINLTLPSDTPYETVKQTALQLEDLVRQQPETKHEFIHLGVSEEDLKLGSVQSPTSIAFTIFLKEDANADHLIDKIITFKDQYPNADFEYTESSGLSSANNAIVLDLSGSHQEDLETAAKSVTEALNPIEGIQKISTNLTEKKTIYNINVDPGTTNVSNLAMQLNMQLNQIPIGSMILDGIATPILLDITNPLQTGDNLQDLKVIGKTGEIALSEVAKIEKTEQQSTILRKNSHDFIRITATVDGSKLSTINNQIALETSSLKLPDGVSLDIGGAGAQQSVDTNNLFTAMIVSIGIIYLLLVIMFKNLRMPFVILFSLPFAAVGSILGLIISRIPVDTFALIGALMLIGIVVTNAIVLLDRVKQNEKTMIIREALIEAGNVRLRPILMTAAATIFALLPVLFSKPELGSIVSKGLAVVVVGGLAVSTLLTLVVVPVIYEAFFFRKSKRQRLNNINTSVEQDQINM
ncbi:hydrophobic/amphiphilic exporter-1, HAE1 family [Paenibacillus uliginis N3/975]|uniref:Hydrophobic/amphiphilic exporter-1, HAE1 family n=1 Tax=Paenibacillus uliginis N3/975 TaxID=1313296 RepID=A0A1X7HL95_9BACL|nr:efflux RND transporter permease subunit [Paenibacillus uliginis]SMF88781.1 hydrophobic/amphiphilic exporter-1, HAE1 family [Paenibacillus uliginis N3/975]